MFGHMRSRLGKTVSFGMKIWKRALGVLCSFNESEPMACDSGSRSQSTSLAPSFHAFFGLL